MRKATNALRWGNQAFSLCFLHKIQKSELGLPLLKSRVAAHATADCPSPTDLPPAWLPSTSSSEPCPGIEGTGLGRPGARLSIITPSALLSPPFQGGGSSLRSPRRSHQPPATAIWRGVSSARNADGLVGPGPGGLQSSLSFPPSFLYPLGTAWCPPRCHLPHLQFPKDLKGQGR